MPLISADGMRSIGPANFMFFIRFSTSDTRAAASTRARFAPRQKWVPPPPNAKCQVQVGLTSHIEAVVIDEVGLVPIGRRVEHRHPVALLHGHPA
jgi:hypothetical protein